MRWNTLSLLIGHQCDGRRPRCGQCEKRHVICPGYSTELDVVFVQPGEQENMRSDLFPSDSNLIFLESDLSQKDNLPKSNVLSKRQPLLDINPNPQILPPSYLAKTYQTQTLDLYLDTYLPHSSAQWAKNPSDGSALAWLPAAVEMSSTDPLLHDALLALSFSHLGDGALYEQERTRLVYGNAVRTLSARIQRQQGALTDSTLAAIMAMGAYEGQIATSAGAGGWLSHVEGSSALIRLRGTDNFATPFGEKLFLGAQLTSLVAAIGKRKAMPISTAWPKKESNSYLRLFKILKLIPAIMEQADLAKMFTRDTPEDERTKTVSMNAYLYEDFRSRISIWYDQLVLDAAMQGMDPFWSVPSMLYASLPSSSPARVFPTCFDFVNVDIAQQLLLSWTGILLVNLQMMQVGRLFGALKLPTDGLFPTGTSFQTIGMLLNQNAQRMVQSMEYFVHPDRGKVAQDFLGLPLNLAFGFFNASSAPESLFLQYIVSQLTARHIGLGKLVTGMAARGGGKGGFSLIAESKPEIRAD